MLWGLLLTACPPQSPCEAQGGRCTSPELDCGAGARFIGYDSQCEPDSKCCVPVGAQPPDAGEKTCVQRSGKCQTQDLPCPAATKTSSAPGCSLGNQCCVPAGDSCMPGGYCATKCMPNEKLGFGAPDCASGQVCCSP